MGMTPMVTAVQEAQALEATRDVAEVHAIFRAVLFARDALRVQLAAAEELAETLKQQAMQHAHEARTQTSTVHEIYQLITGGTGEPGDWEGAEPVRVVLAAARADAVREFAEWLTTENAQSWLYWNIEGGRKITVRDLMANFAPSRGVPSARPDDGRVERAKLITDLYDKMRTMCRLIERRGRSFGILAAKDECALEYQAVSADVDVIVREARAVLAAADGAERGGR